MWSHQKATEHKNKVCFQPEISALVKGTTFSFNYQTLNGECFPVSSWVLFTLTFKLVEGGIEIPNSKWMKSNKKKKKKKTFKGEPVPSFFLVNKGKFSYLVSELENKFPSLSVLNSKSSGHVSSILENTILHFIYHHPILYGFCIFL